MARPSQKDEVKKWQARVTAAQKAKDQWCEEYRVHDLERWYAGPGQWPDNVTDAYTINLIFPSVETKLPSLLFFRPKVKVLPRPARADDPGSLSDERAKLLEDTADTFIASKKVGFKTQAALALKEAFYSLGVLKVGYSNDFIENPNAGKPVLKDGVEQRDGSGETVYHPNVIPDPSNEGPHEWLYVKRIPAKHFLVPVNAKNELHQNDWVAYCEWHHVEDVKRNPRYKNTTNLKPGGSYKEEFYGKGDEAKTAAAKMVLLWFLWDLRTKTHCVWAEGHDKWLLDWEPYDILPFAVLKFHDLLDEFYPLPPLYNWLSPQKELNETREMQKVHRRRFARRYEVEQTVEQDQLDKLADPEDGTMVRVPKIGSIAPIADAPLDGAIARNIPQSKEDFREISAISGEQRGVSEAETATQASIIDINSRIRETADRQKVAEFLGDVVTLILTTIRKRMALPFWVQMNTDPEVANPQIDPNALMAGDPAALMKLMAAMAERQKVEETWKAITSEELGPLDWEVTVDVESLSPANEDLRRNQWLQFMSLIGIPPAIAMAASDVILRKTAGFFGIRSERDLMEVKTALVQAIALQNMMAQTSKGGDVQGPPAPGPTPGQDDINAQLAQQLPA